MEPAVRIGSVLELTGVEKRYGRRTALSDVNLVIAPGELVGLVGANGAGKTTLLRIIVGFLDADRGQVVARVRAIGYLPEHTPLPLDETIGGFLATRASIKGVARIDVECARVLSIVGLTAASRRVIVTLSKGMRQRLGLADALLGDPSLLVLDEPTEGLDPVQLHAMRTQVRALVGETRSVLVSTHAVTDLEGWATRVIVLARGRIVGDGSPAELCERGAVTSLRDAVVNLMTVAT